MCGENNKCPKWEYCEHLEQEDRWTPRYRFVRQSIVKTRCFEQPNGFSPFWTLWRTRIEIAHQKVGTAASASKPSTTKRKKKKDFNGLKRRRRRRDFYRGRQKIHHRTDRGPPRLREGREGRGDTRSVRDYINLRGKEALPSLVLQILDEGTAKSYQIAE